MMKKNEKFVIIKKSELEEDSDNIENIFCEKKTDNIHKIYVFLDFIYKIIIYECDLSRNLLFKTRGEMK